MLSSFVRLLNIKTLVRGFVPTEEKASRREKSEV